MREDQLIITINLPNDILSLSGPLERERFIHPTIPSPSEWQSDTSDMSRQQMEVELRRRMVWLEGIQKAQRAYLNDPRRGRKWELGFDSETGRLIAIGSDALDDFRAYPQVGTFAEIVASINRAAETLAASLAPTVELITERVNSAVAAFATVGTEWAEMFGMEIESPSRHGRDWYMAKPARVDCRRWDEAGDKLGERGRQLVITSVERVEDARVGLRNFGAYVFDAYVDGLADLSDRSAQALDKARHVLRKRE